MKEEKVKHPYRASIGSMLVLLFMLCLLAACGGTANSASSTTSGSGSETQSGGISTGNKPSNPVQTGMTGNMVTGTITKYDASTKQLTLKLSNGSTETLSVGKAIVMKSQKITTDQLATLLKTSGLSVRFTGKEQSTNTYLAQQVTVSSMSGTSMGGNPPTSGTPSTTGGGTPGSVPPGGGTPPSGGGNGSGSGGGSMPGGNPPTSGTPGTGTNPTMKGTPQPGVSTTDNAGAMMLSNAVMKTNQLVGTTMSGQSVTVNLNSSTVILHQTTGTTSDLQVGAMVTAMLAQVVSNTSTSAQMLIVGAAM